MKPSLSLVAITLSIIAIIMSLSQPTYNFLTTMNKTESGKPSFSMSAPFDFYVFSTFTRITLSNTGTATAHDVQVQLIFFGSALENWEATEFIPEINKSKSVMLEFPIGYYQLNASILSLFGQWFTNITSYEANVHVKCNELDSTTSFHFQHFIT